MWFHVIPIKIPTKNFRHRQAYSKLYKKGIHYRTGKTILTLKNEMRGVILPNVKAYYTARVIETMRHERGTDT